MSLTRQELAHLASLARLQVTDEELDVFSGQLQVVLSAVEAVAQAPTEGVPPTSHPLPLVNVWRDDEVRPCLPRTQVLAMAPAAEDGRFRVPRMLDDE